MRKSLPIVITIAALLVGCMPNKESLSNQQIIAATKECREAGMYGVIRVNCYIDSGCSEYIRCQDYIP